MDVSIIDNPKAVFAHEIRKDWCSPAGVETTLAILGLGAPTDARQRELASRVEVNWERYVKIVDIEAKALAAATREPGESEASALAATVDASTSTGIDRKKPEVVSACTVPLRSSLMMS